MSLKQGDTLPAKSNLYCWEPALKKITPFLSAWYSFSRNSDVTVAVGWPRCCSKNKEMKSVRDHLWFRYHLGKIPMFPQAPMTGWYFEASLYSFKNFVLQRRRVPHWVQLPLTTATKQPVWSAPAKWCLSTLENAPTFKASPLKAFTEFQPCFEGQLRRQFHPGIGAALQGHPVVRAEHTSCRTTCSKYLWKDDLTKAFGMNSRCISPLSHTQSTAWNHRANTRHTPFQKQMSQETTQAQKSLMGTWLLALPCIGKEIQIKVGLFSKAVKLCSIPDTRRSETYSLLKKETPSSWEAQVCPRTEDPDLPGLDLCHRFFPKRNLPKKKTF